MRPGDQWYSVEQVAALLGLHVKTVRGYVRDGRLQATRIGKQYRIARADLESFTGRPLDEPHHARPRAEVTSVVQVDAVGRELMDRLSTYLTATVSASHDGRQPRVEIVYDEERAAMKIVILADLDRAADILRLVDAYLNGNS
ncbi:helix-turn-helix domain-containing protein [Actinomadura sp. NPDC047616]|uniref:helix-turn-helix domain-containing protein n=1 Tax=Actinomadura sp. NPDC047616 TaxID=3155914 RepID=UPI0033E4A3D7